MIPLAAVELDARVVRARMGLEEAQIILNAQLKKGIHTNTGRVFHKMPSYYQLMTLAEGRAQYSETVLEDRVRVAAWVVFRNLEPPQTKLPI